MPDLQQLSDEDFCYLTTSGRISGRPHTIEIWFALNGQTLYILSDGRHKADWVKNILKTRDVQARIRKTTFRGQGRIVYNVEEDAVARKLVFEKYAPRSNEELEDWSRTALPVAVDLVV